MLWAVERTQMGRKEEEGGKGKERYHTVHEGHDSEFECFYQS
jgi:hypothetical protein